MSNFTSDIIKPTFIIDKNRVINNITILKKKFSKSNTEFRPHFKTHQSTEIGQWFLELGITKISVSSVDMAWQFYQAGWRDISIVFPVNPREIERINLMAKEAKINVLIEDLDTLNHIDEKVKNHIGYFIKIDCGYHRTGIDHEDKKLIRSIALRSKNLIHLHFKGILSHFGNTYSARGAEEITKIYQDGLAKMQMVKQALLVEFPNTILSLGDTPSASTIDNFTTVDEMRPGNFVFYDWMQREIGSCNEEQIAAIMLCPVVAKHTERKEIVIHGGAVHFSKEKGDSHYGAIVNIKHGFNTELISNTYLKSLSQEHGIIECSNDFFIQTNIGDLIGIIPIHSCLTANLMKQNTRIV